MSARVLVVGAGITGLTAARRLAHAGAEVEVLESDARLGGKISTSTMRGHPVEDGPDMFLARVPWARDLCDELGLTDELVAPATGSAFVWRDGAPRRLPAELVLGAPTKIVPLLRSGVLPTADALRAGLDLLRPRSDLGDDPTVGELIGGRFGRAVTDRLVDPLIGGINAGAADHLSAAATAPQLLDAARSSRSLLHGLRRARAASTLQATGPVFWSLRGGLGQLVAALHDDLSATGAKVRTGVRVRTVLSGGADGVTVVTDDEQLDADAVVLTTPAHVTAGIVAEASPAARRTLDRIRAASVSMAVLAVPDDIFARPLDASGLLFPRVDGNLVTAVSFGSTKWPHWADGHRILRVSVGRMGDDRGLELDDDALVAAVLDELDASLGLRGAPLEHRVVRWIRAFPQYEPGHADRVTSIRRELAHALPGVEVAGAAFEGLGIPACVRQGGEVAERVLARTGVGTGR
ncbi:MAG: protoporphyrinogen oxidase [Actinomycetota bacterium]